MNLMRVLPAFVLLGCCAFTSPGIAVELILDGDFEAQVVPDGVPAVGAWSTFSQIGSSSTNFFVDGPGTTTPISSFITAPATPGNGSRYAVSDQNGPGATALLQPFTVPVGVTSLTLSFDMFVNDADSGPIVDPSGLDFTTAGANSPNQHARVDILTAGSGPLSTAAVDVLLNVLPPFVDPQAANPNPFTSYNVPLPLLAPGDYQLRFAEVDNQGNFHAGVDNVSLVAIVPEPATLGLLALGLTGAVGRRRRR